MNTKKIVVLSLMAFFAGGITFAQEPQPKKPIKVETKKGSVAKKMKANKTKN